MIIPPEIQPDWPVLPIWPIDAQRVCTCRLRARCKSPGKHPHTLAPEGVHSATTDRNVIASWSDGLNLAIAAGHVMHDGRFLCFVDVDPRNGGDESLAALEARYGVPRPTLTTLTGGGGQHYAFGSPVPPVKRTIAPGLDFIGIGGYVIAPPSRHASGRRYTFDAATDEIADLPAWLIPRGERPSKAQPESSGRDAALSWLGLAFEELGWLGRLLPDGKRAVRCPWLSEHSDGRGDGNDASTAILPPRVGETRGAFVCQHSHCSGRKTAHVLAIIPLNVHGLATVRSYKLRQNDAISCDR